jgi:hypothetical protein
MKQKYRIIEHRDGNEDTFYSIQFQFTWIFGLKHWQSVKSYSPDGSCSTYKMFSTLEEAQKYIKGQDWTRKVVYEGEL